MLVCVWHKFSEALCLAVGCSCANAFSRLVAVAVGGLTAWCGSRLDVAAIWVDDVPATADCPCLAVMIVP